MRVTDTTVSAGDVIELGETVETVDLEGSHLRAVTSGPSNEHVVLREPLNDGDTLDVPRESVVLGVTDGPGMASDTLLVAVPTGCYDQ